MAGASAFSNIIARPLIFTKTCPGAFSRGAEEQRHY